MRILILSQHFWPENFRINDLVLGLKEQGHDVEVLTAKPNYPKGRLFKGYSLLTKNTEYFNGMKVMRVPVIPRFSGKSFQLVFNYLSFVFFACLIAPFRCRKKYDVIYVYLTSPVTAALPAILLKKLTKAKLFLWVQDLWPESVVATNAIKSRPILSLLEKLVGYIYRQADKILVSSKSFSHSIVKYAPEKKDVIEDFPNSVEALYQPVEKNELFKQQHQLPEGFIVMFAGNVGYAQDFTTILRAADATRYHRNIHWVILGEGRHFSWVQKEVRRLSLDNVHLLGSHPMDLMPDFFSHADVMLVTLKNEPVFSLTVPCKIQSYLACAKPIIAGLNGDGANLINEAGAGIAVEPGNAVALAKAVLKMAECSKAEIAELGQSGYIYYQEHFRRDLLLDKLNLWLKEDCFNEASDDAITGKL